MKTPYPVLPACLLLAALAVVLAGCLPIATELPPEPTSSPLPATETPTPTIVWFPPTATYTPYPTPVITPTLDARPLFGEVLFQDQFTDTEQWSLGRSPAGSVALGKSELTLAISRDRGYLYSLRSGTYLRDFSVEVTASPSICRGEDEYGLLLRVSPAVDFYRFSVSCKGEARLDKFVAGKASSPQGWTPSGAIPPGAPSVSRLAVIVIGKDMHFYVNDQFIFSVRDPTLTGGSLGVFARAAGDDAVTVSFSNLIVYATSQ